MAIDRLAFVFGSGSVGALLLVGAALVMTTIHGGNSQGIDVSAGNALPSIELAPDGVSRESSAEHSAVSLRPID